MNFQDNIRYVRNELYCLPWRVLARAKIYKDSSLPIKFVSEEANWAIKTVGENIKKEIDLIKPNQFEITTNPSKTIKKIVHFGSQYMWLNWGQHMSKNNLFISTFFHGKHSDGTEVKKHIEQFLQSVPRLSKVITASSLVEKRLISWGVPNEKVVKIPLGVNTAKFTTTNELQKSRIRESLKIPSQAILIGSFQKDGIGWGEGLEPKMIKGPDLFVKTLKILSKKNLPVYALLTGPSRGYVKKELKKNNIPFYHSFVSHPDELIPLYQALDLYLITSREEGGPMGLLESMSCGIPVVSTKVGMADDVIKDNINGAISNKIDAFELANKVEFIISDILKDKQNSQKLIRDQILIFDWKKIAKQHWEKIYKGLL